MYIVVHTKLAYKGSALRGRGGDKNDTNGTNNMTPSKMRDHVTNHVIK